MDSTKKISIVVAAYNEEKYIGECLNSLIRQTYNNIEIIVVDDGSSDSTVEKVEKFSKQDSRIKLFSQQNSGLADARNSGIKLATGDYIGFVDGDDFLEADMFEKLVYEAKNENADIVCCSFNGVSEAGKYIRTHKITDERVKFDLKNNASAYYDIFLEGRNGIYSACNKLYNRQLIVEKNVYFEANRRYGEDVDFNLNYSQHAKYVVFIPNSLYNYRATSQSITRGYVKDALYRHLNWLNTIHKYIPNVADDSDRTLKLRKLSAENLLFSVYQEIIYNKTVDLAKFLTKTLEIDEYNRAYQDVTSEMITSKYDRILWRLLKSQKYKSFKLTALFRHNIINIRKSIFR